MIRFLFTAPLLFALAACATARRDELVWISVTGDRDCVVAVEGRRFPLPDREARLRSHLASLARTTQGAILGSDSGPPSLRCWAAAMFVTQRAGFARLGFIDAPEEEAASD